MEVDNSSSTTLDSHNGYPIALRFFVSNASGLFAIAANFINLLVLRLAPSCFGEATTCLVQILAVIDMGSGLFVVLFENLSIFLPLEISSRYIYCFLFQFFRVLTFLSSIHLITFLTLDRLIAIKYPLRYHTLLYPRRIYRIYFFISQLDLFIALLVSSRSLKFEGLNFDAHVQFCEFTDNYEYKPVFDFLYQTLTSYLGVLLPFAVTILVNVYLLFVARNHVKRMASVFPGNSSTRSTNFGTQGTENQESNEVNFAISRRVNTLIRELKVYATFAIITGVFIIAWMPTNLVIFFRSTLLPSQKYLSVISFQILSCNSWANSFIYLTMIETFRKTLRKVFNNLVAKVVSV